MTDGGDADLTIDLDGVSTQAPEVPAEATESFANAALIGGEKLKASGFFVNIVKRATAAPSVGATPRVLVVEDDPGTSAVIDAVLRGQGFDSSVAADLQGILRALQEPPPPDVIVLDILLPDANGFAVLERLRRHPDLGRVPVVMLTSLDDPADVAKGLALGATGYLSKPARPEALVAAIRAVLGLPAAGR